MKILLAIDGSPSSRAALRSVATQRRAKGNTVRVLHVMERIAGYISADMIPHAVDETPAVESDIREEGERLLRQTSAVLRKAGFRTSQALETGDPKSTILDEAARWGADLIVLGSHGLTGLNRFLMGSVSEAVTKHAGCSVEVVRARPAQKKKRR